GVRRVGDEVLRAVQYPVVAVFDCRSTHASGIAPRSRLGRPPGADPFARREFRQPLFLLLVVAGEISVAGAERVVRGDRQADAAVDDAELLDDVDVVDVR